MKSKFPKFLGDRILIESVQAPTQSLSGLLILPEEKMAKLIVIAIGTSKKIDKAIKIGSRVWALARGITPIILNGKGYFSIPAADILAVDIE